MSDSLSELRVRLYLDQDVRVQLAGMLRAHSFDVLTTLEADRLGQPDPDQLAFATTQARAILTHNRMDFESLHLEYLQAGKTHAGILIARQRYDLAITKDRILDLLNRLDRDQVRNGLYYV